MKKVLLTMLRRGHGFGHQVFNINTQNICSFVFNLTNKTLDWKQNCDWHGHGEFMSTFAGMAANFTWWNEDYGEPYPGYSIPADFCVLVFLFSWKHPSPASGFLSNANTNTLALSCGQFCVECFLERYWASPPSRQEGLLEKAFKSLWYRH